MTFCDHLRRRHLFDWTEQDEGCSFAVSGERTCVFFPKCKKKSEKTLIDFTFGKADLSDGNNERSYVILDP